METGKEGTAYPTLLPKTNIPNCVMYLWNGTNRSLPSPILIEARHESPFNRRHATASATASLVGRLVGLSNLRFRECLVM